MPLCSRWAALFLCPLATLAGYALGAAAGFECGAARGAATMLRALAPRLPADFSGGLQQDSAAPQQAPAEQQQAAQQQPGGGGAPASDAISDMPFQELQREVCQALMSAPAPADAAQPPALPPRVRAAVDAAAASMRQLGLQAPRPSLQEQ